MRTGVVLAGGDVTFQLVPSKARAASIVIAVDSGLDLAERIDLTPTLVVGDLDSVSGGALDRARAAGVPIEEHPRDKDQTDLELGLAAALAAGAEEIVVLGGAGGRLDHLLANVGAISSVDIAVPIEAWLGEDLAVVVTARWWGDLAAARLLSVLPWGGPANVSEVGVRWPLDHADLAAGSALGVSNEALGGRAEITVHAGRVVVLFPTAKELV